MIGELQDLLDKYAQWLRDTSVLREVASEYVEVTTPYLDRHNDYLQIYVKRDGGGSCSPTTSRRSRIFGLPAAISRRRSAATS